MGCPVPSCPAPSHTVPLAALPACPREGLRDCPVSPLTTPSLLASPLVGLAVTSSQWVRGGVINLQIVSKASSPGLLSAAVPCLGWISSPAVRPKRCCCAFVCQGILFSPISLPLYFRRAEAIICLAFAASDSAF